MFTGTLKKRCYYESLGILNDSLCKDNESCEENYICGKGIANPHWGITNFDTIFWSLLTCF